MARPNFRIVEGGDDPKVNFEQLKKDYLNPKLSVRELLKEHNLSRNEYLRLKDKLIRETGIKVKPNKWGGKSGIKDITKYISQDPLSLKFRVAKYKDGMLIHYGRYSTLEEAVIVRDALIKHNWDWKWYWENIRPHQFTSQPEKKFEEIMSDFEKDYLAGMTGAKLMKKYGLSKYHLANLSTSIKHKHGLTRKPTRWSAS